MNAAIIHKGTQKGSVLIVSMLILLVLTLIGVTAMGTSALEEKMAGNSRDQNQAFQASEAALRNAEVFITGLATTNAFTAAGANGLYSLNANPPILADATWVAGNTQVGTAIPSVTTPPRFIVEIVQTVGTPVVELGTGETGTVLTTFRITTRGTGGTDNASVLLQSYFARTF